MDRVISIKLTQNGSWIDHIYCMKEITKGCYFYHYRILKFCCHFWWWNQIGSRDWLKTYIAESNECSQRNYFAAIKILRQKLWSEVYYSCGFSLNFTDLMWFLHQLIFLYWLSVYGRMIIKWAHSSVTKWFQLLLKVTLYLNDETKIKRSNLIIFIERWFIY